MGEALGLQPLMAPKLATSFTSIRPIYECVLVSLMTDGNLKTGDKRKKVDFFMKKVEAVEDYMAAARSTCMQPFKQRPPGSEPRCVGVTSLKAWVQPAPRASWCQSTDRRREKTEERRERREERGEKNDS